MIKVTKKVIEVEYSEADIAELLLDIINEKSGKSFYKQDLYTDDEATGYGVYLDYRKTNKITDNQMIKTLVDAYNILKEGWILNAYTIEEEAELEGIEHDED